MEISEVRKLFPYLKQDKIYFNHASIGPLSQMVLDRINDFLLMRSETAIDDQRVITDSRAEALDRLSRLLNTTPDRIAFFDNTSNGLNVLAQGFRWQPGDRIILNDVEFPSNVYPFMNLKTQGVEVDFVRAKNGVVSAEDIIDAMTPETKLVSISFVQFLSGYSADMKKIGKACRERGIVFCVDAAQGLGAFALDVEEAKIDFLACGSQKWLMGLMGLAFIYISDDLQSKLTPRYVGWTSVEDEWTLLDYDMVLKKTADAFQNGTISIIGVHALNASLELFEKVGYDKVSEYVLNNSEYFINRLHEIGLEPPLYGIDKLHMSGIVSFKSPLAKAFYNKMVKNNIACSLREGMVRFSPHFYNTKEEIDLVVKLLKEEM